MTQPSVLLIHGGANGAWVWEFWRRELKALGWDVNVLDLQGHGRSLPIDLSTVTMQDYAADVQSVAGQIAAHFGAYPVIGGWSMGGLLAMMHAAEHHETPALLLFESSPPLEVQGRADPDVVRSIPSSVFSAEEYGLFSSDLEASRPAMPGLTEEEMRRILENSVGALESGMARRQRKRGITVPKGSVECPSLAVYGDHDDGHGRPEQLQIASHLGGEALEVPGASHWGLVYSEKTVKATAPSIDAWLRRNLDSA